MVTGYLEVYVWLSLFQHFCISIWFPCNRDLQCNEVHVSFCLRIYQLVTYQFPGAFFFLSNVIPFLLLLIGSSRRGPLLRQQPSPPWLRSIQGHAQLQHPGCKATESTAVEGALPSSSPSVIK